MNKTINVRGRLLDLSQPVVMGILNVTPDSFYSESRVQSEEAILQRAHEIVEQGGSIIDVGACSTRPGGVEVDEAEELRRLGVALRLIRREMPDVILSVDTFRPIVARRCVEEWGADIINDVAEGLRTDADGTTMATCISRLQVPYILMSVKPDIQTMVRSFGREVAELHALGVKDIILDPGFGFGKTLDDNYAVLAQMELLQVLQLPILVGVSRKSMIYKLLNGTPQTSLNGTTVLHSVALQKGADILRVHDVRQAVEVVSIITKLKASS